MFITLNIVYPFSLFLLFLLFLCPQAHETFSLKNSIVYGPGLKADFVMPVRYFFIQCIDSNNENITFPLIGKITVKIEGINQICSIWTQLLNIGDGGYVVRYKLYNSCDALRIEVKYDEKHIAESPYLIKDTLHNEYCFCPKPLTQWFESMECPKQHSQIQKDLQSFSEVDMDNVLEAVLQRFNKPGAYSICHYSVIDNQIYRKCYGQYVGFSMFMDGILLSLARKMFLPDMQFMVNLGDWPLEQTPSSQKPIPIFSWCGSKNTHDIVMPTYDLTESTMEMMGRITLDVLSSLGNQEYPWKDKIKKGFWRGRDSRQERLDLIALCRKHPDLINASLTNFFFFREKENQYGPKEPPIPFFQFFKYRYQINLDGTVAAYRFPYLVAGDSVVLKQESEYYEHFYSLLAPMTHYIPFKRDLSDLVEKLMWAKQHDKEVQGIIRNARQFTKDNLLPQSIYCYYALLLKDYSALLKKKPKILPEMEHVPQPKDKPPCHCTTLLQNKKPNIKEEL